jgi:histidinol-phosphate phosphatase family protein
MCGIASVPRAGVLLDRDGTIIEDYHYVGHVERVQFKPGAIDAIRRFNKAAIPVIIVTNQSGVARGFYPLEQVYVVHEYMKAELARHGAYIDLILFSPDHPDGNIPLYTERSRFHKPGPGMALEAAKRYNLDLERSFVVGDRPEDVIMGYHIKANIIYLGRDLDSWSPGEYPIHQFHSLADAAGFIIERITGMPQTEFPDGPYNGVSTFFNDYVAVTENVLKCIDRDRISRAVDTLYTAFDSGGQIFIVGNGGAAAIANHAETDLIKHMHGPRWYTNVRSLAANNSIMTAVANDIGFDSMFSFQLEQATTAGRGDVLLAFSVSGQSQNIVNTIQRANEMGMDTIAIVANDGGEVAGLADVTIHIPTGNYGIAEDIMNMIMHSIAQYIRQTNMSEEQIRSARF